MTASCDVKAFYQLKLSVGDFVESSFFIFMTFINPNQHNFIPCTIGIEIKKDRVLSTFSVDKVVDKNVDIQKFSQCTIKGRWYLFDGQKTTKRCKDTA
ncbi:hypothetical protein [Photorhabdus sp. RM96S]|uniref:hypothetical protein n=1 Tax=Photorhabdus sp. RM96S TaxID=3342822 RepID=UPI0036DA5E86